MDTFTPAQLEAFTGLSVGAQRAWDKQGLFMGRNERTKGGQRRFRASDVLFVASVREIAALGLELPLAAQIADLCLPEISSHVDGSPFIFGEDQTPFLFIWRSEDTTDEAGEAFANGSQARVAHPSGKEFMRLADLNRIPFFSKSGGTVLIPSDIAKRLPQAVKDLFTGAGE